MISTINLYDADGDRLVATVLICDIEKTHSHSEFFGPQRCSSVLEGVKALDPSRYAVSVYYTDLGVLTSPNRAFVQPGTKTMLDLDSLFPRQDVVNDVKTLPVRLVCPAPNIVPVDSLVKFVLVETVADVLACPSNAVMMFPDDKLELMQCMVEYKQLFGFVPHVLSGVPSSDYSVKWDSYSYSLERTAYESLINDLIEASRNASLLSDESKTNYDKEKEQFTRKNGTVKELKGTSLATSEGVVSNDKDDSDFDAADLSNEGL